MDKTTIFLYRMSGERTENTRYFTFEKDLRPKERRDLVFLRRYNNITLEQHGRIHDDVVRYKGPQKKLLDKIDEILE